VPDPLSGRARARREKSFSSMAINGEILRKLYKSLSSSFLVVAMTPTGRLLKAVKALLRTVREKERQPEAAIHTGARLRIYARAVIPLPGIVPALLYGRPASNALA